MTKPPISFSEKASASKTSAGGYPIQISAKDLDANFAYATLEVSDTSRFRLMKSQGQAGTPKGV